MALPRTLCRKWQTISNMRKNFCDLQFRFCAQQTKGTYRNALTQPSCHYRKLASHHRWKHIKPEISSTNVCHCSSSALYINRAEEDRTPTVNVDLDLMERLHDVTELEQNLSARKIDMNVVQLAEDFRVLMKLELEKGQLEEKRKSIADMMAALSKVKVDDNIKRSREVLKPKGKALKEALKSLIREYNELESYVVHQSLRLPNNLHKETPLDQAVILQELIPLKDLPATDEEKNHVKIGQKLKWLKFSDVGAGTYYLLDKLAWLEQDLIHQFSQNMNGIGFFQLNCPEIFRTLVMEGCGVDYKSPDKIYTLQNFDVKNDVKVEHLSHFVGVSPMSFAAYLTRMELKTESLPLRYFTIGKSYQPVSSSFADSGLYEADRTSKCESCCVCKDQTQADSEFNKLVNIMWAWYSDLGLPCRLVLLPAAELQLSEMKKITIEAWAPSLQRYLQVGSVSSSGTYISKRLMISHTGASSDSEAVHLVHAEFVDISKLIAFLVEYGKISDDQSQFELPVLPEK